MPQVLELINGEIVTPRGFFDVMDLVEEYIGSDARQYIEAYFEEDGLGTYEDDDQTDHYMQVLDNIDAEVCRIELQLGNRGAYRKQVYEGTERIKKMICREKRMFEKETE